MKHLSNYWTFYKTLNEQAGGQVANWFKNSYYKKGGKRKFGLEPDQMAPIFGVVQKLGDFTSVKGLQEFMWAELEKNQTLMDALNVYRKKNDKGEIDKDTFCDGLYGFQTQMVVAAVAGTKKDVKLDDKQKEVVKDLIEPLDIDQNELDIDQNELVFDDKEKFDEIEDEDQEKERKAKEFEKRDKELAELSRVSTGEKSEFEKGNVVKWRDDKGEEQQWTIAEVDGETLTFLTRDGKKFTKNASEVSLAKDAPENKGKVGEEKAIYKNDRKEIPVEKGDTVKWKIGRAHV